ncbi:hypothetical protein DPMN_161662 [Dreissena polymorpha]|uniref:Uncharacterized protein n=1 Tax=Dreissena polymorpha TaxID=45954 RepID=A0A9D4EQB2_DREPO|nr:hypothetical protein DPMN_161662 [Dreissena polymorpha]
MRHVFKGSFFALVNKWSFPALLKEAWTDNMQAELTVEKVAMDTSVGVDDPVPVIDISNTLRLLDLISSGHVMVQDADTSFPLDVIGLMPMDT